MAKSNTALHSYAYLVLRISGRTFSGLARECGCNPEVISMILLGQKKSRRLQEDIAVQLGFGSWIQLSSEAQRFYADFQARLEEVRVCG